LTEEWFILLLFCCLPLLFKVWQRSGSCCSCYIVYHYCLRFDRQTLNSNGRQYNSNNMNHSSVIPKRVMVDNIKTTTWTTPLSNIKEYGRHYNQPKQHAPLLCQTLNSNSRQHNNNNMNHSSVKTGRQINKNIIHSSVNP
jgi:hypothetical protein